MKSTDMFSSAEARDRKHISVSLVSEHKPQGLATSPFVVSLWDSQIVPEKIQEKNDDTELQSIEDLFRGKGRIPYDRNNSLNTSIPPINTPYTPESLSPASPFSNDLRPAKKVRIPSHQEQVKRMQEQKNEYSAIFRKPGSGGTGFFRNFAFWK